MGIKMVSSSIRLGSKLAMVATLATANMLGCGSTAPNQIGITAQTAPEKQNLCQSPKEGKWVPLAVNIGHGSGIEQAEAVKSIRHEGCIDFELFPACRSALDPMITYGRWDSLQSLCYNPSEEQQYILRSKRTEPVININFAAKDEKDRTLSLTYHLQVEARCVRPALRNDNQSLRQLQSSFGDVLKMNIFNQNNVLADRVCMEEKGELQEITNTVGSAGCKELLGKNELRVSDRVTTRYIFADYRFYPEDPKQQLQTANIRFPGEEINDCEIRLKIAGYRIKSN